MSALSHCTESVTNFVVQLKGVVSQNPAGSSLANEAMSATGLNQTATVAERQVCGLPSSELRLNVTAMRTV